jgi:glutamate-1-semialdehyde aminotransferase
MTRATLRPSGRTPEEHALLEHAMRVLPGGVLGGYHAPQELAFIVREARGAQFSEPTLALAEEIRRAVPGAEQVRFCSTGTEATFLALRLCGAYRTRDKILKFEGSFHGTHDYSLMSVGPRAPKAFPAPTRIRRAFRTPSRARC